MGSDDFDFEAEMRALGVSKNEPVARVNPTARAHPPSRSKAAARGRALARSKAPLHAKPPLAQRAAPPSQDLERPTASTRRIASAPSTGSSRPIAARRSAPLPASRSRRPLELVEHELKTSRDEVLRLKSELAAAAQERARAALVLDGERAKARQKDNQMAELEADLSKQTDALTKLRRRPKQAVAESPGPTLSELLTARGVLGADEQVRVMSGLAQQGKLSQVLRQVRADSTPELSAWIDENTALLGDCGECPAVGSRTVLQVPRFRCEVCGGSDIQREARRFVDACLNGGTTRVTLVGGSPKYHRQLRDLIQHRVLKLRLIPGDARRSLRQARDDLRGSDLVVIWGGTVLDHSTSVPYTQQRELGRLVTVPHRGITLMLSAVVDHLSKTRGD